MMNSLSSILRSHKNPTPIMRGVNGAMATEAANDALVRFFGEQIKEYAQAIYIKNEILHIACLSPAAAQEIKLQEQAILAAVLAKVPTIALKKIGFCI